MPYTYPPNAPARTGDTVTIHRLLKDEQLIAKRLRTLASERFLADMLLTGRFTTDSGSVAWDEDDAGFYTSRAPETIRPGGEYPLAALGMGTQQNAATQKWGQDVPIKDEAISRLKIRPVDVAFNKLINTMVKTVDGVAMAAILSRITNTQAARTVWTSPAIKAKDIFLDVAESRQKIIDLGLGYDPDVVVVPTLAWVNVMATFADEGYLPREDGKAPVITGEFPVIDGMRWVTTPYSPVPTAAMITDTAALGGMADEQLGGPGYVGVGAGIETKSIREDEIDGYRLRARRVTVPVVTEPASARLVTGVAA